MGVEKRRESRPEHQGSGLTGVDDPSE